MTLLFTLLLLLDYSLYIISGQFTPHLFCLNMSAAVTPGAAGTVQFIKTPNLAASCSLNLTGMEPNGYISLPGIDPMVAVCNPSVSALIINSVSYCITLENSSNRVILPTSSRNLEMTINTTTANNFSLDYYTSGKFHVTSIHAMSQLLFMFCVSNVV